MSIPTADLRALVANWRECADQLERVIAPGHDPEPARTTISELMRRLNEDPHSAEITPSGEIRLREPIEPTTQQALIVKSEAEPQVGDAERLRRGDLINITARVARLEQHHDQRDKDGEDCGPAYINRDSVIRILQDEQHVLAASRGEAPAFSEAQRERVVRAVRERLDHHAETDTAFDPEQLAYCVLAALKETP